jgi:hypothetical protein
VKKGLIVWLALGAAWAHSEPAPQTVVPLAGFQSVHQVQPNDTLWALARLYYGRVFNWPEIQQANAGIVPRRLVPGSFLLINAPISAANGALVEAVTGDVHWMRLNFDAAPTRPALANTGAKGTRQSQAFFTVEAASQPAQWQRGSALEKGAVVPIGAALKTGPASFATLLFPNGSRATLPPNSHLKLVNLYDKKGLPSVLIDLAEGQVDGRVAPANSDQPSSSYRVRTRYATIGARGTYFRVRLPTDPGVLAGVLEGKVAADWSGQEATLLAAGQGSYLQLAQNKQPVVVQALLPAPAFQNAGAAQRQERVVLQWSGVGGASAYRVQMARDAHFNDLLAQRDVDASPANGAGVEASGNAKGTSYTASFEGVAEGTYHTRVSALAPDQLEGLYSSASFVRSGYTLVPTVQLATTDGHLQFTWNALPNARYVLELASDQALSTTVLRVPDLVGQRVVVSALPPGQYFWRVQAIVNELGQTATVTSATLPMQVSGVR